MVVGYALLRDWRMLSAVAYPLKNIASIRAKRKTIQGRRRVSDRDLIWWFHDSPRAIDVEPDSSVAVLSAGKPKAANSEDRP